MKTYPKSVNLSAFHRRAGTSACADRCAFLIRIATLLLASIAFQGVASADTLSFRSTSDSPTAKPTVFTDAKVTFVEGGQITFTSSFGTAVSKPMAAVLRMTLDDEPTFNAAEQDYAARNYGQAVDEFDQTIQKTDKTWLQTLCWPHLTDAANRAGRFDKAVQGYAWMVLNGSPDAGKEVPTVPAAMSPALDAASTTLQAAVDSPNISPAQETPLLSLLLNVQRVRGDSKSMEDIAQRLGSAVTDPNDPNAHLVAAALAEAKISEANDALKNGDLDSAASIVNGSKPLFNDANLQSGALFILAQVADGRARKSNDADGWRDAAIAYLRVASNFKDVAGTPHVADSLLKAAGILDQELNEPDKALHMYQSIAAKFPGSPSAAAAADQVSRLQSAGIK